MGCVTIEITKWERVISPCMGGKPMIGLIVVLVGTISDPIFTSISPMPWAPIVGVSLLTSCVWWMANVNRRGGPSFS